MSGLGHISHGAPAPFPALMGNLPPEADDPQLPMPREVMLTGFSEPAEQQTIDPNKVELAAIPSRSLDAPPARRRPSGWTAMIAFSCLLHAAGALALLAAGADRAMIAGSQEFGGLMLGNADADQSAEGGRIEDATQVTLVPMLAPRPVETVAAEPVEAMTTEAVSPVPAEATPIEPDVAQPVAARALPTPAPQQVEPVQEVPSAMASADPAPPILTAEVMQPVEDATGAPSPVERTMPERVERTEAAASEDVVEPVPETKPIEKKAVAEKPAKKAERESEPKTEKKRPAKKKAAAKKQPKAEKPGRKTAKQAGSGGKSSNDAKRGVTDGETSGEKTVAGKGGTRPAAGNAAVSNYPGKVAARLRRASRGISGSARGKARGDVRVSFTVTASGGLAGLRIASSSGSPDLDKTALAIVRRAAPFPPIPPEAGRSSWAFTLPLGI